MTERQEKKEAVKLAKNLFQMSFGRIYKRDIVLLETYYDGKRLDSILFRNHYTGREYRVLFDLESQMYFIEEMNDRFS